MKRVLSQFMRSSVAGVMAGAVVVGAVVATTSARRFSAAEVTDTTVPAGPADTVPGDDPAQNTDPPTLADVIDQLANIADDVSALVEANADITERVDAIEAAAAATKSGIEEVRKDAAATAASLKETKSALGKVSGRVDSLDESVASLRKTDEELAAKTAKLDQAGNYSGPVDPAQLTRRLTPSDISGSWPLGRTVDKLDMDKLALPMSGCWADSRYHVLLSVDAFSRIVCTKVLK